MKQEKTIHASLEHVVFYPSSTTKNSFPTIVALHGRGTDEYDLLPLVESLGIENAAVIAPRAPLPFNPGALMGGYAWYESSQEGIPDPRSFQESLEKLRGFLEEIKTKYPVDIERLVLLGFSQGTVMAYAAGLLNPTSIKGIVALSGYVPQRSGLPLKLQQLNGLPVFISHGVFDELIPLQLARESAELLRKGGAEVLYREYYMGHEVREETLLDLAPWAKKLLY